ncbi:retrieval of early ER protein Rer1 [Mucor mucedo]|uniref:retrieval of early ER protein Rer1 n=1 Tax=Mucor mucedo TaxID=29922 RepID=UPI00221F58B8|nr:retrieval of early ER protein Rer1 [Mucor mucedo]KAI7864791.1 retrieval of early ER protein Rer1 [Mucor mucedo]
MEEVIEESSSFSQRSSELGARWQTWVDRLTPYTMQRWVAFGVLFGLFILRILFAQGWYIVCYALGIYLLNMFLAFLTPKFDPCVTEDEEEEGPSLPTRNDQEFRPFIRRLPEFKFWYSSTKATLLAIFCSFFSFFDIPVFWPILLAYFCILFALTMRRQIQHMVKYRYVPFDFGKQKYRKPTTIITESTGQK